MAVLIALGVVFGVVLLLVLWGIGLYNGLVVLRNRYKNAYAQIDVQLKRRYDLIPNLVETAKGYLKHGCLGLVHSVFASLSDKLVKGWHS